MSSIVLHKCDTYQRNPSKSPRPGMNNLDRLCCNIPALTLIVSIGKVNMTCWTSFSCGVKTDPLTSDLRSELVHY